MSWLFLRALPYRYLWTTQHSEWCFREVVDDNGDFIDYLISRNGQGTLRIHDDELSHYIKEQMKKAGTKIISAHESLEAARVATEAEMIRHQRSQRSPLP
jgi:hypothetical protein